MAIRNIRRQATNPGGVAGTPGAAPIYVDSDDNKLKMIPAGSGTTEVTIGDSSAGVAVSSTTGTIGYATGSGGAVTQLTNRTTGVTLNTTNGQITTNNASLAAEAAAEFTVTNSTVAIGDVVVVAIQSGSNGGATDVFVSTVAAGSFKIKVVNNNPAAGTAETGAIIINFAVIKAVAA